MNSMDRSLRFILRNDRLIGREIRAELGLQSSRVCRGTNNCKETLTLKAVGDRDRHEVEVDGPWIGDLQAIINS